jgi:hypothetical protein
MAFDIGGLLEGLFGGGRSPQAQDPNEIAVPGKALPKSRFNDGSILGDKFSVGSTGRNILGGLGDAFLLQAGMDPRYAPKLKAAREAEAMEDFTSDPRSAIMRLNQIDPDKAAKLWGEQQDFGEKQRLNDSSIDVDEVQIRNADDIHKQRGLDIAAAVLGTARSAEDYPAIRAAYYRTLDKYGAESPIDLPESIESIEDLYALRNSGIPAKDQATLSSQAEYRDELIKQREAAAKEATNRTVITTTAAGDRAARAEEERLRRLRIEEEGRDRRAKLKGGKAKPGAVKFGTRPDGTRYVLPTS